MMHSMVKVRNALSDEKYMKTMYVALVYGTTNKKWKVSKASDFHDVSKDMYNHIREANTSGTCGEDEIPIQRWLAFRKAALKDPDELVTEARYFLLPNHYGDVQVKLFDLVTEHVTSLRNNLCRRCFQHKQELSDSPTHKICKECKRSYKKKIIKERREEEAFLSVLKLTQGKTNG